MSQLSDYVTVNITRETARVTRTGFGITTIAGAHYRNPNRSTIYTDPADMLDDGFETTDPLYIAALIHMAQQLSPTQFKIAKKNDNVNAKATLEFTGTPSAGTWTLDVGIGDATPVTTGNITYTASDDSTLIETAIEALSGITEVTVSGSYAAGYICEFTGADANTDIRITAIDVSSLTGVTAATVTMDQYGSATETWVECLNAICAEDDDFYFFKPLTITKADLVAMAAVIETKIKLMSICTNEADILNGVADNTMKQLKAATYDRSFLLYNANYDDYPDAGLIGGQAPKDPGSITWKFKNIVGAIPDILTATQKTNITSDYGNTYETVGGVNMISSEATVASGEYIDIIRGTDWLQTRMSEAVFSALVNNDKIPFTDQGIGVIEGIIMYWLKQGEAVGLLAEGQSVVNTPDVEDVDPTEKAQRYLSGITFSAVYAGAIHKVGITGKITI